VAGIGKPHRSDNSAANAAAAGLSSHDQQRLKMYMLYCLVIALLFPHRGNSKGVIPGNTRFKLLLKKSCRRVVLVALPNCFHSVRTIMVKLRFS